MFKILKTSYFVLAILVSSQENAFSTLVKEFESEHFKFIPLSEENKDEAFKALTLPEYRQEPYTLGTTEEVRESAKIAAQKKIELYLSEREITPLNAWLLQDKELNQTVGFFGFRGGNILWDAADAQKNPEKYIEAGGLRYSDHFTEIGGASIKILEKFKDLKLEIIKEVLSYGFNNETRLAGIDIGLTEFRRSGIKITDDLLLNYFQKTFPYTKMPQNVEEKVMPYRNDPKNNPDKYTYCFTCTRDFFEKNMQLNK